MMHGLEKTLSNTGCPWPGGTAVSFEQSDVLQLGRTLRLRPASYQHNKR